MLAGYTLIHPLSFSPLAALDYSRHRVIDTSVATMKIDDQPLASGSKRPCPINPETVAPDPKRPVAGVAVQALAQGAGGMPLAADAAISNGSGVAAAAGAGAVAGLKGAVVSAAMAEEGAGAGVGAAGGDSRAVVGGKEGNGSDLQILEVTNDGDPANMEMLIHLKVRVRAGVLF